jgi:hypothetical protein
MGSYGVIELKGEWDSGHENPTSKVIILGPLRGTTVLS